MIELPTLRPLAVPLEGVAMALQPSPTLAMPTDRLVSPTQVWAQLAADLQARAVRLMAQLAFNLVAAQSGSDRPDQAVRSGPGKEARRAAPTQHVQDPT